MPERFWKTMEEWKVILAVIGMIVYFLLNARKATKKIKDDQEENSRDIPQNPPVTFEEMMKQIMEQKEQERNREMQQERSIPEKTPLPEPKPVSTRKAAYDSRAGREQASTPRPEIRQHVPVQEHLNKKIKREEARYKEETVSLESFGDRRMAEKRAKAMAEKAKKPEAYQKSKVKESVYAELLHSPESARKAFVLSEIFNRKY